MVDISKLNNIAAASIAKVDNIAIASIANIDWVVRPAWASWWAGNAVDMDWSTESLAQTTAQSFWFGNAYTFNLWFSLDNLSAARWLFLCATWTNNDVNGVQAFVQTDGKVRIVMHNASWTKFKDYTSALTVSTSTRTMYTVTRDGTNFKQYFQWVEDTGVTKSTDSSNSLTSVNRRFGIFNRNNGTNGIDGKAAIFGIKDSAITSWDVTNLYNSWAWYTIDMATDYSFIHQRVPWEDSADIWHDYVSSWWIDMTQTNLTAADIVTF